jgi:hypothetical protein
MPRPQRRPSAPEIRPARPEDLPALARLGAKLAREHHAMDGARNPGARRLFRALRFRPTMIELARERGAPAAPPNEARPRRRRKRTLQG